MKKLKLSKFIAILSLFLLMAIGLFLLFKIQSSKKPLVVSEPSISRRYIKARILYNEGQLVKSLELLAKVLKHKEMEEDIPRATFLTAECYRKLAEQSERTVKKRDKVQTFVSDYTVSATYLDKALSWYSDVVKTYPEHFLADDAMRWIGGCYFRRGLYLSALGIYFDLLENYPKGDQAKEVDSDAKMCFRKIMAGWTDLVQDDRLRFFRLLQRNVAAKIIWNFPQDCWKKFNQKESVEFIKILKNKKKFQEFLWTAGFSSQVAYTYPLNKDSDGWLKKFMEESFYSGNFETAYQICELLWNTVEKNKRGEIETYLWGSCLASRGAGKALDLCLERHLHNGIVALAFDWISKEDLEKICIDENVSTEMDEIGMLRFILAMRYYADKKFKKALDVLFTIVNSKNSNSYSIRAWKKIIEIEYFLDLPKDYSCGASNYDEFYGFLGKSIFTEDLKELEKLFWGDIFIRANETTLKDIYSEYNMYEKIIWGKRNKKLKIIEITNLQVDFLRFITSSIAQIKNLPEFKTIPKPSQIALNGILEIATHPKRYDFYGSIDKFSRQKVLFKKVVIPYINEWQLKTSEEFRTHVLPLLGVLHNISYIGKITLPFEDRLAYLDYEKGAFLCGDEILFKREIEIYRSSWSEYIVNILYNFAEREKPLMLVGHNYTLAKEYFISALQKAKDGDLKRRSMFMSARCIEWYARSLCHSQSSWLSAIDVGARFIRIQKDNFLFSSSTADAWAEAGMYVPFMQERRRVNKDAISQYNLFASLFPEDKLTDDAYYHIGHLYDVENDLEQGEKFFNKAIALGEDMKVAAKASRKNLVDSNSFVSKIDALSMRIWFEFMKKNYKSIPDLYEQMERVLMEYDTEELSSHILYILGLSCFHLGDFEGSGNFLRLYLEREPNGKFIPQILETIIQTNRSAKDYKEMVNLLDKFINDDRHWLNHGFYKMSKGLCYGSMGQWSKARECYKELLKSPSIKNEIVLTYYISKTYFEEGRVGDAEEWFKRLEHYSGLKILFKGNVINVEDLKFPQPNSYEKEDSILH